MTIILLKGRFFKIIILRYSPVELSSNMREKMNCIIFSYKWMKGRGTRNSLNLGFTKCSCHNREHGTVQEYTAVEITAKETR